MEKITGIIRDVQLVGGDTLFITLAIDGGEIRGLMPGDSTLKQLLPVCPREKKGLSGKSFFIAC